MGIPAQLTEFLNRGKVRYEVIHHPQAFTAQELAAIEHVKGKNHAKVVIVKAGDQKVMVVLPADRRVDLAKLDKLLGQRTMLATEAEFKALFPDCAVGTMPPFGQLYGLPVYVDRSLTDATFIVFEAGTHTDAIRLSYADYARLAQPQVADVTVNLH
jgi:Ala-tRNA(Pro) deacylase